MPLGKQKKSREDTWREDELKKSLKEISDDRRKKESDERRRSGKNEEERRRRKDEKIQDEKENKRSDRKSAKDDDKRLRDEDGERRRPREEGGERRRQKEDDGERRRRKEEEGEKRRHKDDGERRRQRDEDGEKRRHRDEDGERMREKDEGERRRRRDEDVEKRRQRDDDGERRRPRDEDGERRRRRNEDGERRRRRNEDGEQRRPRDEDGERRRHKDEDGERRHHRDEDGERRRHKDDDVERRRRRDEDGERRRRRDEDGERRGHREDDERRRRRRDETEEERIERKRRERKEREAREAESNVQSTTIVETKKSPSTTHNVTNTALDDDDVKNGDVNGDEEGDNYDDDFEDYEDDFEEGQASGSDDEQEPVAITPYREHGEAADVWRAVNQENQKLLFPRQRRDSDENSPPSSPGQTRSRPPPGGRFINFVSAKQRSVSDRAATRVRRRYHDLCKMIELDFVSYDLFDMPPVNEYDRYILNYGRSDTKQAYVQTNEDAADQELQTDEIESRDKWTQHPSDDNLGCGGEGLLQEQAKEHRPMNYARLERFVREAGRVMTILLEESESGHASAQSQSNQTTAYSDVVSRLTPPFSLEDSPVVAASFSPSQSYQLLTAHRPKIQNPRHPLYGCGVLYEWNLNQPSRPQRLLADIAQTTCCCFSPNTADLAFAGNTDGSVVVWDLREPASGHRSVALGSNTSNEEQWTVRSPTYSTAMVLGDDGHNSSVVSICPVMSAADWGRETLVGTQKDRGLSFQLATLEQNGCILIWVVAQLDKVDRGGSETDLGLAPGGRVRLIKSAQLTVDGPNKLPLTCTGLQISASDANQFFVSTDAGLVVRCSRHTIIGGVRYYHHEFGVPVRVTSLDVSPFGESVFLVGTSEGEIRLHRADQSAPVISWDHMTRRPIRSVRWSRSRACVFFAMDEDGGFFGFDLSSSDSEPFMKENVKMESISCLELGNDYSANGLGTQGRRPQMVVCGDSGVMEVHTWARILVRAELDETYRLGKYIQSLT